MKILRTLAIAVSFASSAAYAQVTPPPISVPPQVAEEDPVIDVVGGISAPMPIAI
ncbi:MAG: Tol-Pal system protein TolB, partial [Proteobacteria bacterium]